MRTQTAILSIVLGIAMLGTSRGESPKASFGGKWKLDNEKSEDLPAGTHQTMTVKQTGDRLEIEVEVSGPQGNRKVSNSYIVNGQEAEFTLPVVGGGTPKGG